MTKARTLVGLDARDGSLRRSRTPPIANLCGSPNGSGSPAQNRAAPALVRARGYLGGLAGHGLGYRDRVGQPKPVKLGETDWARV